MKVDIPEEMLVRLVLDMLPNPNDSLGAMFSRDEHKSKLRDFLAKEVINKINLKPIKITQEEVKMAVLDRLAEEVIEKMER